MRISVRIECEVPADLSREQLSALAFIAAGELEAHPEVQEIIHAATVSRREWQ